MDIRERRTSILLTQITTWNQQTTRLCIDRAMLNLEETTITTLIPLLQLIRYIMLKIIIALTLTTLLRATTQINHATSISQPNLSKQTSTDLTIEIKEPMNPYHQAIKITLAPLSITTQVRYTIQQHKMICHLQ